MLHVYSDNALHVVALSTQQKKKKYKIWVQKLQFEI